MNDVDAEEITTNIDSICTHLNAGLLALQHGLTLHGQVIWHAALMHNYAIAETDIVYLLIITAILVCGLLMIRYQVKRQDGNLECSGALAGGVLMIAAALMILAASGVLSDAIARLASPQYMTAQDILSALKG